MNLRGIVHQRGVTLIELMVALLISTLLIAGAVSIYSQSRSTYRTTETAARLQEIGRYALNVIEPDVRLAGFWGMMNRPDLVANTVADASITGNCAAGWIGDASRAISGIDGGWTGLSCAPAVPQAAGTDALIVKRADSKTATVDANRVQIQSTRIAATIFKDAALPSGYSASSSETRNMIGNIYYVTQDRTLRRKTLVGSAMNDEEIIPGVQDLQVQFGIDISTPSDGMPDKYVNADGIGTGRVVSARIWLLIVSDDIEVGYQDPSAYAYANRTYSAFTDQRRRVLLSKTIQIRNSRS